MVTRTININQLPAFTKRLQKELSQASLDILEVSAKALQEITEKNAPVGPTGSLKHLKRNRVSPTNIQIIGPSHWSFINRGLAPDFPIPIEMREQHISSPGSTAGKPADITNPKGFFQPKPSQSKGFVRRSTRQFKRNVGKIINKEIAQAYARI